MATNSTIDETSGVTNDQPSMTNGRRETDEDSSRGGSPFESPNSNSESVTETPDSDEQNTRLAALANKYGYQVIKENGQRKFCAPADWNLPSPPRGCEVFIGKLPRDVFEDELFPLFSGYGQIQEMRLMMDFSGSNRGYAFVTYTNRDEARRACLELNNYEIRRGRHIGVVSSVDNCRLFVGGIPRTRTREEVRIEMMKLTEGVVDVILYPSAADKTKNRGFAFVEYDSHRAAAKARRKLLPNRIQLWGSVIAVDWAEPEQEVDEATMANVKVLYVRNLMVHTTEDTLRQVFEKAVGVTGSVERVKKMRDFAFIHFATREQALLARDKLNDSDLDGAQIEVVLSKPPYQSNIVRCMKNLQKSGGARSQSVTSNGNEGLVTAAIRQVYAPSLMNNILASPMSPSPTAVDPAAMQAGQPVFSVPQTPVAAAYTGFPCIDLYTNQTMMERQASMASQMGNGSPMRYTGGTNVQPQANGHFPMNGRTRGAAGMRSAGVQAMISNTLRHQTMSRRKASEQFLYDLMLQQQMSLHQQQLMAQHQALVAQQPNMVMLPGTPGLPFWRQTVTSPTGGYVPMVPTTPLAFPIPPTSAPVPVVSESAPVSVSVTTAVPASAPASIATVADSNGESSAAAPAQQAQQPQIGQNGPVAPILYYGNTGVVPVATYQQQLNDLCRDQGWGIPQYERIEVKQKDSNGRDMTAYTYKITIPILVTGGFQNGKYFLNDAEAREAAAHFVLIQLITLLTPATPSIMGPSYETFGMTVPPTSPWFLPEVATPIYYQHLRRPVNHQFGVNTSPASPPATGQ